MLSHWSGVRQRAERVMRQRSQSSRQEDAKVRLSSRSVPKPKGLAFLAPRIGRHGNRRDNRQVAAEDHYQPCRDIQGMAIGRRTRIADEAIGHAQPVEGRTVIGGGRGELEQHLGEPMGAGLLIAWSPQAVAAKRPVGNKIIKGWTRRARTASFTSRARSSFPNTRASVPPSDRQ